SAVDCGDALFQLTGRGVASVAEYVVGQAWAFQAKCLNAHVGTAESPAQRMVGGVFKITVDDQVGMGKRRADQQDSRKRNTAKCLHNGLSLDSEKSYAFI